MFKFIRIRDGPRKISKTLKGRKRPLHVVEAIRQASKGKIISESHKKILSECNKGISPSNAKRQIKIVCIETGEIFPSISEAARTIKASHTNITHVLRGTRKQTKGFTFKYYEHL